MDHFYQQKLINEKNELQRQVTKANKQIAQLSEQAKQYETLLASLDEGMIPSQIRLRGGPIDQAGVHERSFVTQAHAQDRKLTDAEHLALVRHAKNDSKANQRIAGSKPQPPKSKELEGQQLKEQAEYIAVLENIIATIAQELQVKPEELIESVTLGRLDLSTLGRSIKSGLNRITMGKKKESGIGTKLMPGTISTSPYDPYVGEKETPRGDVPQGAIPRGLFKQPSGSFQQVRSMTSDEIAYDIEKRKRKQLGEMRVVDSLMSGGIRSAAKAVASNVRQRGVLGGLGVNPSKGFVNKLSKTKRVPIVKGETGEPVAAGRFSGLGKALGDKPQLSAPERAANRVITGTAEPNVVSGPMGPANVQKVKPDLTVIKKPLNP